jgi:hypothetical protein
MSQPEQEGEKRQMGTNYKQVGDSFGPFGYPVSTEAS